MIPLIVRYLVFAAGTLVAPSLARLLLRRRGYASKALTQQTRARRAAISLPCVALGLLAAFLCAGLQLAPCMLAACGLVVMEALVICDLAVRILPWEGCLTVLVIGSTASLLRGDLASSALLALLLFLVLLALDLALSGRQGAHALGAGDLRLIPALALAGGLEGTIYGSTACALVAGAYALVRLVRRRAGPGDGFPLGPALLVWYTVICASGF